jgi:hypothetical protein
VRTTPVLGCVVAVNLALTVAHGIAHATIPVVVRDWQAAAVTVTVVVGPLVAVGLVARGCERVGLLIAALAGTGALAFEGLAHFVVDTSDHVGHVTDGAVLFVSTAGLSTFGDAVLVAVAGWLAVRPDSHAMA